MVATESPVTVLNPTRAWDLLAGQQIGRIVVVDDGVPEIFPINYVVDGESIVFRTAAGTKLDGVLKEGRCAFEIDTWDIDHGYSVVLRGGVAPVTEAAALAQVEALPLKPWVPTVKTIFVRIMPDDLSARRFAFGADPTSFGTDPENR